MVALPSPPKTATPFDNGLVQDGIGASDDSCSPFNFPEISLGSETSSKEEEYGKNVEAVGNTLGQLGLCLKSYLEFDGNFRNENFSVFFFFLRHGGHSSYHEKFA